MEECLSCLYVSDSYGKVFTVMYVRYPHGRMFNVHVSYPYGRVFTIHVCKFSYGRVFYHDCMKSDL